MIHLENSSLADQPLDWTYWLCLALTAISALVSLGFSLAGLRASVRTASAKYAAARSIALLVGVGIAAFLGSTIVVIVLGITLAVMQAIDAAIGVTEHDRTKTLGPAFLAAVTLVSVILLGT